MAKLILMPDLPDAAPAGAILAWRLAEGDAVVPGTVLAEIACAAGVIELEAGEDGILGQVLVPAGEDGIGVGTPIARIIMPVAAPSSAAGADGGMRYDPDASAPLLPRDEPRDAPGSGPVALPPVAVLSLPLAAAEPQSFHAGARLLRWGNGASLVALPGAAPHALAAADDLAADHGIEVDVIEIDLITVPSLELVCTSVSRSGRLVCVDSPDVMGPLAAVLASEIASRAFDDLDAPPLVVGLAAGRSAEEGVGKIIAAVRRVCYR
ncbi:MAG: transketolase C-terminal domain-containing protein [Hyphomicrobiaceae bacterium]|nr:transketolase C-terminal domain-containing protein [Hyphomicrobiaceae bacterium]